MVVMATDMRLIGETEFFWKENYRKLEAILKKFCDFHKGQNVPPGLDRVNKHGV